MATIRDVAARAAVSVSTVSRVLNQSGYADPETRDRVLKASADLNYQTNVHWSRLKSQRANTILFLLGNRKNFTAFQVRLLDACEVYLQARGYDLVFSRSIYSSRVRSSELPLPRMVEQNGAIDGVILAGVHSSNLIRALDKRRLPYALLGNNFEGEPSYLAHNCVIYDDQGGIEEATRYLLRMGHRRIAFVGNLSLSWFQRRFDGFRHAMQQHGLDARVIGENWQVPNTDYGQLAAAQLLREPHCPTAILAGNDSIAAGVWKELMRRDIAIPREISLIGLGDRDEFAILEPALTSISVFEEQLAERLSAMLLDRIENPKQTPPSQTYPCKLIERASCAPPQLHTDRLRQFIA